MATPSGSSAISFIMVNVGATPTTSISLWILTISSFLKMIRLPNGSSPGQSFLARDSSMTDTSAFSPAASSAAVKLRPRSKDTPSVRKYSAPTRLYRASADGIRLCAWEAGADDAKSLARNKCRSAGLFSLSSAHPK